MLGGRWAEGWARWLMGIGKAPAMMSTGWGTEVKKRKGQEAILIKNMNVLRKDKGTVPD